MSNNAYLCLGSNQGDRLKFLKQSVRLLGQEKIHIYAISRIYETDPQDFYEQPKFLNCVIAVQTEMAAMQLLNCCQMIEEKIGKNKKFQFGPRNIDIDILTFNDDKIFNKILMIPHPRMHERHFVLAPLKDIAPKFSINGIDINTMLAACSGQKVNLFCKSLSE